MRLHRVHWWLPKVSPSEDGHPLYVWDKQTEGRITNPSAYKALYVGDSPAGAVAETFGNSAIWTDDLFVAPSRLPGGIRAITEYEGDPVVYDLDSAPNLAAQYIRPSRVVTRQYIHTRAWAYGIFTSVGGDGIRWWSYHDPDYFSFGLWNTAALSILHTEPLYRKHPAVSQASYVLGRVWQ